MGPLLKPLSFRTGAKPGEEPAFVVTVTYYKTVIPTGVEGPAVPEKPSHFGNGSGPACSPPRSRKRLLATLMPLNSGA